MFILNTCDIFIPSELMAYLFHNSSNFSKTANWCNKTTYKSSLASEAVKVTCQDCFFPRRIQVMSLAFRTYQSLAAS